MLAVVWFSIMIVVMIIINDDSLTIPPTINILIRLGSNLYSTVFHQRNFYLHLIKDNDYLTNVLSRGVVGGVLGDVGGNHCEGVDESKEQLAGREENHLGER